MMEEWKEYKIGDICRIKHGFAFKGIHFVDEPQKYVCLTPGNFALKGGFKNDKPKYYNGPIPEDYVLQKDDLVVTMTDLSKNGDTLGYSALIPYDEHYIFLHNQRIGLIEDISTDIDKHFLYWVMRTYDYQRYIVGHCSGSTVKHTSPSGIGSYIFRCPEMKMQKEIASVLDNLDDKIEVNRRINENLEQQAQVLFKSWFVDFEPFKNGEFVESELGMIPKGWRVGKLGEIADITMGASPVGTSYNVICEGDVFYQGRAEFGFRFPHRNMYTTEPKRFAEIDSILLSVRAPVGDINVAEEKCCIGRGLASIKSKKGDSSYILYLMKSLKSIFEQFNGEGTVFGSINKKSLEQLSIIIPQDEFINKFERLCNPIDKHVKNTEQESRRLASLRDTLLPKLMSGELRVGR